MRTLLLKSLILILGFALGGCATVSRPKYQSSKASDSAAIKGDTANVVRFFTQGESHVNLVEIDGLYLDPGFWGVGEVFLTPGKHQITVVTAGNNYTAAQDTVEAEFTAKHNYRFTALLTGIAFDLTLWDETDGIEKRSPIGKWRLSGQRSAAPTYIPIMIPVK